MFRIRIEDLVDRPASPRMAYGIIEIGEFAEWFECPLDYWPRRRYEQHWEEAKNRIAAGAMTSCFITSISHPPTANFFQWWPVYRVGDRVVLRNGLLFLEGKSFDEADPYATVEARDPSSQCSEWSIPFRDFISNA